VFSHTFQGTDPCEQFLQDADQANDPALGPFFLDVQAWQRPGSTQTQALFAPRLRQSQGCAWNQTGNLSNLTIIA
jgi:hypothetical protein